MMPNLRERAHCPHAAAALVGIAVLTAGRLASAANSPPAPPTLMAPADATVVNVPRPDLVILGSIDPDGDALVYDWELVRDPDIGVIVDSGTHQSAGGAHVVFQVAADLTEDQRYCWRARSDDGQAVSASATACFLVSAHNDPPRAPVLNNPSDNMGATTTTPVFSWMLANDPEGDHVTYDIEVRDEVGALIGATTGVTCTITTIMPALTDGAVYAWRARATDRWGASSAYSQDNVFTVNAPHGEPDTGPLGGGCQASDGPGSGVLVGLVLGVAALLRRRRLGHRGRAVIVGLGVVAASPHARADNAPPPPPTLLAPQHGTVIRELRPDLVLLDVVDPDSGAVVYDWDLARDPAFTQLVEGGRNQPRSGETRAFHLAYDLEEDHPYCWRARADDGQAASPYRTACFAVSARNDPPSVPILVGPTDGAIVRTNDPWLRWAPVIDPEGDDVTYDVELEDDLGNPIASATGIGCIESNVAGRLTNHWPYQWRVRATDPAGASSGFSAPSRFQIDAPVEINSVDVDIRDGGCQSSRAPGPGALVGVGLALAGLIRRRGVR